MFLWYVCCVQNFMLLTSSKMLGNAASYSNNELVMEHTWFFPENVACVCELHFIEDEDVIFQNASLSYSHTHTHTYA